jgi:predicted nucleic acid-binding protein
VGWLDPLQGQLVGIDTAPLIYYIERNPQYLATVRPFFQALDGGRFTAVSSVITLAEVLVHPLRVGNPQLAQRYRRILQRAPNITTLAVTAHIAEEAAQLRATYNLRTPDALQIATAHNAGAAYFLTNDSRFSRVQGITVLDVDSLMAAGAQP